MQHEIIHNIVTMKIAVIYGSSTGATEDVAKRIAGAMNVETNNIMDVANISPDKVADFDVLLLGSSTWGVGDLQDDWYNGIEVLKKAQLGGKKIGIFGTGDSGAFSESFCSAIGKIYEELQSSGATFIGKVDPSDYSFTDSEALIDGQFVGLPLDEANESDKTDDRIANWVKQLQAAI